MNSASVFQHCLSQQVRFRETGECKNLNLRRNGRLGVPAPIFLTTWPLTRSVNAAKVGGPAELFDPTSVPFDMIDFDHASRTTMSKYFPVPTSCVSIYERQSR